MFGRLTYQIYELAKLFKMHNFIYFLVQHVQDQKVKAYKNMPKVKAY